MAAPPSMDLYPGDLLKSCARMSPEAFGAYVRLILDQWEHGSITSDAGELCRVAGAMESQWPGIWEKISDRFVTVDRVAIATANAAANATDLLQQCFTDATSPGAVISSPVLVHRGTAFRRALAVEKWNRHRETAEKRAKAGSAGGISARERRRRSKTGSKSRSNCYSKNMANLEEEVEVKEEDLTEDKKEDPASIEDILALPIPTELDTPAFLGAWREWLGVKQGSRHPWTLRGARSQLSRLNAYPVESVVAGIHNAISEGWRGIWPDRVPAKRDNGGLKEDMGL